MSLAFYLIIAGIVLLGAVFWLLLHRRRVDAAQNQRPPVPVNLASTTDAILLTAGFGRITYANEHARQWFGLNGGEPDLELLAVQANPPDVLRDLFAMEGRASLNLGQRRVDASSHLLPGDAPRHMVVIMRDMADVRTEYGPATTRALIALGEVGQCIADSAPLSGTLDTILDILYRSTPYDAGQICLLNEDGVSLTVLAERGDTIALRMLEAASRQIKAGEGYTGWVTMYRQPLLVEDGDRQSEISSLYATSPGFRSYIGAPMVVGNHFLGLVQLACARSGGFDYDDLTLLEAVTTQTATAIDKARLYDEKVARTNELTGIQAIAQTAIEVSDSRELFSSLSLHIAESLDVEMCGILLYNAAASQLVPARPFHGIPNALLTHLRFSVAEGTAAHRIWLREEGGYFANWLAEEGFVVETGLNDYLDVLSMRSLALMPMKTGNRRIGMVLISNRRNGDDIGPQQMQQLHVFAAQCAVVVDSMQMLERDRARGTEIRTLQQLGLSMWAARDYEAFYADASARIASLLNAEMAGLLLHDAYRRALVAHPTFYGADSEMQDYLQISVAPGSPMERVWREEEGWVCNDVAHDPLAKESGVDQLNNWIGLTNLLLVPLIVAGRPTGAVMVGNKQEHLGFNADEARLANIFAAQIAVALENTRLQTEVQTYVNESRALRKISEIVSKPAALDEIVQSALHEICAYYGSDIALVNLLDQESAQLKVLPQHVIGAELDSMLVSDAYGQGGEDSVSVSGKPFLSNDLTSDPRVPLAHRPAIDHFGLRKAMIVPLKAGGDNLGELIVADRPGDFSQHDLDVLRLIAAQLSAAIERLRLYAMTDQMLRIRVAELDALARVSNELAQTVELDRIMHVIRQEALRVTGAADCSVMMLSPSEEWADLEQPEVMHRHGAEAELPDQPVPVEAQAIESREVVYIADYAAIDMAPEPANAVSALVVPIFYDEKAVGVIHLFASFADSFDERAEIFGTSLALKASTAYGNSARFREQISRNQLLNRRVEQLSQIFELGQVMRTESLEDLLDAVAHSVQMTAGYSVVLISLFDEAAQGYCRVAQAGIPLATFEEIRGAVTRPEQVTDLLQDRYQISQSYFLPAEEADEWRPVMGEDVHYHLEYQEHDVTSARWRPDDALIVPLRDTRGGLIGYMSVDAPVDGMRPVRSTLEPLEVFAQQAAIGIENFRLVEAIQREADSARRERDLLERLYAVSTEIQRAEDVSTRLQVVAQGIQDAGWRRVHITLRDEHMDAVNLIHAGYTDAAADALQARLLPGEIWRARLTDPVFYELRLGTAFYLRYNAPWIIEHVHAGQEPDQSAAVADNVWHPDDQLVLPIYGTENRLIGLIVMEDPQSDRVPTEATVRPIELFANQAANAIEMTRLYQETSRSAEQEALFNEMMQAVTSTLDTTLIVRAVADGLQRFVTFTHLMVAFYDEVNDQFETIEARFVNPAKVDVGSASPVPVEATALGKAFSEARSQVYYLDSAGEDHDFTDLNAWRQQGEQTTMIIPMTVGGIVVGVLRLGSEQPRAFGFDSQNMALVQRVANLASVAIENARLYQQTAERERFSAALVRVSRDLNATLDLAATLARICQESLDIMGVEGAYIWQADRGHLVGITGVGPGQDKFVGLSTPLTDDQALAVQVFKSQEPRFLNHIESQGVLGAALSDLISVRSLMGVPLLREGHALGVLLLARVGTDDPFTRAGMERAAIFATQASIAVENARLYHDMRDLQSYTGSIVESIQQGIVVMDRNGDITTLNDFMRVRYGWTAEAEGRRLVDYQSDYEPILGAKLEEVLALGEPRVSFGEPGTSLDGHPIIQNFYLYPLKQEAEITGAVLLVEDVTEQAKLEADLAARAEQLAALTAVSSRLTATLEPDEVVTLVLDQLGEVLNFDGVTLWIRESDDLRIASARGYDGTAEELVGLVVAIEDSVLFRDMAEQQQVLNVPDVRQDARFPGGEQRPTRNWLGAPLISKGQIIGLLALDKIEAGYYDQNHEQLVLGFANQAAVALENARLFADARQRTQDLTQQTEQLGLLNRVSTKLAQSLDVENILEIALQETAGALDVSTARAVLFEPNQLYGNTIVEFPRGDAPPTERIELSEDPAIDYVRRTLAPLVVEDVLGDVLLQPLHDRFEVDGIASMTIIPLTVGGQVIGTLILEVKGDKRRFSPEQVTLSQTIASQAAIAVQNANLLEQSFVRTRELETLFEASQATSATLDLDEVMHSVAQQMLHALEADSCTVMLWDEVAQQLISYADVRLSDGASRRMPKGEVYPLEDFPTRSEVLQERTVVNIHQDDADKYPLEYADMQAISSAARLLVPLVVRENAIGLIKIDVFGQFRSLGLSEQRIAHTLAGQAAIAIENARLNTETANQVREAFMMNDLSRAVSAAVDMRELLPIIRAQVPALTRSDWLYLCLYEHTEDRLSFPIALRRDEYRAIEDRALGADEFSWIINNNRPLILVGNELEEVRRNLSIETAVPELTSFLGVPLAVGVDTVGVIAIADDSRSRAFGLNDQRILTTVASQLAVAIQNASLFTELRNFNQQLEMRVRERTEEVRAERDRLNVLYNVTAELSATLDMDRVLDRALELLAGAVGANEGMVMLVDHQRNQLYKRAELGEYTDAPGLDRGLRLDEGLAGWVIQNRQSAVVEDVQNDPRWVQLAPRHKRPRSTLAVLLETSDEVLGVLLLYSPEVGLFNDDHLRLVVAAANQLSTSINNAELYLFIREQAERLGDMVREQQVEASKSNAVLEGVADGVLFANEMGEITLFNDAAERVLDISRHEIIGRTIGSLRGLFGGGGKRWAETMEQWMRDPVRLKTGDYLSETLELGERIVRVTLAPVRMSDQFLGTVSVFRDITRDVEVDRMKTEFISNVSHELRTPMTSIKGYADLMVMGAAGEINERQRDFLNTIKENADRLTVLVNDLLDISQIDSGRVLVKVQQVDLAHLALAEVDKLRERMNAEGKTLEVVEDIGENLPLTYLDSKKIAQVIANLVDNAYQYTAEGGKITISVQMEGEEQFVIAVSDTGIGIPETHLDRVFDRFYRNDEHPMVIETPGTGLGLALARELVLMHHGQISVESEEGVGTTFFVKLPYVPEPPEA